MCLNTILTFDSWSLTGFLTGSAGIPFKATSSLHHILNVVVVLVVGWGSVRSCRSFWENRINTVQMLRLCAAAVERRALARRDTRISSWQRLLHLPPLRLLMGNDLHVFMHTHTCRTHARTHVESERTQTCMHGVQEVGTSETTRVNFTFFVVRKSFYPSSQPPREHNELYSMVKCRMLALAKFIKMVTNSLFCLVFFFFFFMSSEHVLCLSFRSCIKLSM